MEKGSDRYKERGSGKETGRSKAICGQRYPLPYFAWLWIGVKGSRAAAPKGTQSCRTQDVHPSVRPSVPPRPSQAWYLLSQGWNLTSQAWNMPSHALNLRGQIKSLRGPKRADFRPERADFNPERADSRCGWQTNALTDGCTDKQKSPVFYRT